MSNLTEIAFRHRRKLILIPLLSLLAGAAVILFFPRTYHSEAVLFLQVGRESVGIDPTATTGQTIALQQNGRDDEVKSAVNVLRSRGVLAKVIDHLSPEVVLGESSEYASEPNVVSSIAGATLGRLAGAIKSIDPISKREEAMNEIEELLVIQSERGSTAIEVEIEADSPELAQTILTTLIEEFQQEHGRIHRNQDSQAFFHQQREMLRAQLDEAQEAIRQAKDEMGIASVEGRRATLESQLKEIESEKYSTEQDLSTAEARVADLKNQLSNLPERVATSRTMVPNEGADLMRQELYSLQIRKADLEARYNSNHPLVMAVSNQVEEAQRVVDSQQSEREESVDDVNPVHQQLSLSLKEQQSVAAGYRSRLETLNEQLQLVLMDLKELNANEVKISELEREERLHEAEFFQYAKNMEQARIDQELERQRISNIAVSQEPLLLRKPVSPSKGLVLLASLFLATAGTFAAVFTSERFNDKLRDEQQASQTLGVPVYAEIPESAEPLATVSH
ncbi:GumC family protein [Aeoliella mucimassa]|uniref:GumC family protein n=1 Tax=Aeoliella mucimassa TaxID=2527972 RepID=UPI0018D4A57A|nr:hypothetical protein [Aeoliella mucimassa]